MRHAWPYKPDFSLSSTLSRAEANAVQKQAAIVKWQMSAANSLGQLLVSGMASSPDPQHICRKHPPGLRTELLFSGRHL